MPNTRTNAPRGALVFDMRALSRQAGSARTQQLTVPAPADLQLELVRVPVGAEMQLDLRFEAVSEGVPVTGECARCLIPLADTVTASFTELYRYDERPHGSRSGDKHDKHDKNHRHGAREWVDESAEPDDEELSLDGDLLDLEPVLRDAVVLALPMSPLCREDCPGLCVQCGVRLDDAGPDHRHSDAPDPRWAALRQLDDGQLDDGQLDDGQLDEGQLDEGQLDEGQLDEGQLDEGKLDDSDTDDRATRRSGAIDLQEG